MNILFIFFKLVELPESLLAFSSSSSSSLYQFLVCYWPHGHLAERKICVQLRCSLSASLGAFWTFQSERSQAQFFSAIRCFLSVAVMTAVNTTVQTLPSVFAVFQMVFFLYLYFSGFFLFFPCLYVSKFFCFSNVCFHALSCRNTQPCLQSQTSMIMQIEGEPASLL